MFKLVSSESDLEEAVRDIGREQFCGLDTETYGADFMARMFALQIATADAVWYFNFHDYGAGGPAIWSRGEVTAALDASFRDQSKVWFIHNAKFDLRRLALEGHKIGGGVHCTQMCERFIYNQHMHYSFDACLKRRGMEKDDAVAAYIKEHKLYDGVGDKRRKCFEKVPFDIMFEYGCRDARDVRILGLDQRKELEQHAFYHNDLELEKVAYEMEEIGIRIREDYAQGGLQYERERQQATADELSRLAGEPFRSGPNWLRGIFDKHGVPYRTNPKTGKPVFDKAALDAIDHPIAGLIRQYRRHEKYASTYYQAYVESGELSHAFIKTYGTTTGRFSYAEPNLQNVPKEKKLDPSIPYQVRGCFGPREDYCFVMIDYNQQEFRMFLDYAGEHELIRKINEEGLDAHDATASMVGIERDPAKVLNFALIYGVGNEELARMLGMTTAQAKALKRLYFSRMPKTERLIQAIMQASERRGYVDTWVGRRLHTPKPWYDKDTGKLLRFDYLMPNNLIQGGCADVVRLAMTNVHEILKPTRSRLLVQVHDELLFEFHKDELELIDQVVNVMENTYRPFNGMKLTCGVDHSWVSWGKRDVVAGKPMERSEGQATA